MKDPERVATSGTLTLAGDHELESLLRALARGPELSSKVLPELAPGQALGHYQIIERLGRGSMGVVYRALDTQLGRDVALKLLSQIRPGAEDELRELAREAQVLAALDHPNLVTVYSLEVSDELMFITMEYVAGEDLRAHLRNRGPLSRPEVVRAARELARGLAAAHARGVVHRDVKPENVRISPRGDYVLLDFGLARFVAGEDSMESASEASDSTITTVAGTPAYMAPELRRGAVLDARADVWALGLVILELATGSRSHQPRDLARLPRNLRAVIRRCLAADPGERFADAGDLLKALEPRTGWAPLAAVLVLVAALAAGIVAQTRHDPCALPDDLLAGIWDPQVRARIDAAFIQSELGYAGDARAEVDATFGRYIGDWTAQRRALCERAETDGRAFAGSSEQRCLERLLERAAKLSASFQRGQSDTITIAAELIAELRPAQVCAEQSGSGHNPQQGAQARVFALEDRISVARQLGKAGEEARAIAAIDAAIALAGRVGDGPGLIRALLAKASIAAAFPDPGQALDAAHRVVELASRLGDDEALGEALIAIVDIETEHDRYDEAEVVGELAWRVVHEAGGPDQDIRLREALAALAVARERWDQARKLLDPARSAAIELYGEDHLVVADLEEELAWVLGTSLQDEDLANRYYRHALEIHLARYGDRHPAVATIYNDLGVYHYQRVEYDEAEAAFTRAQELFTASLGAEHRETLTTSANLANLALMRGDLERAIELGQLVLDGRARTLGKDSAEYASSARDHAIALQHLGRADEALPLLLHYHAWLAESQGEHAPRTLDAVTRIVELGLLFEDETVLDHYGALLREDAGEIDDEHPRSEYLLAGLARLSVREHDYATALAYAERRVAWLSQRAGADSPAAALAVSTVGEALLGLDRADEARKRLRTALAIARASDRDPLDLHFLVLALAKAEAALGDLAAARELLVALEAIYADRGTRPHMHARLLCSLAEHSRDPEQRRRYAASVITLLEGKDMLPNTLARARAMLHEASPRPSQPAAAQAFRAAQQVGRP